MMNTAQDRCNSEEEWIVVSSSNVSKGDNPGHPFRGNQWTRGGGKNSPSKISESPTLEELQRLVPVLSKVTGNHGLDNFGSVEDLVENGVEKGKAERLYNSEEIELAEYADPAIAVGNCGYASAHLMETLSQMGVKEVYMRETGGPDPWGTHFVTHVGKRGSDSAIIIDYTLRQFFPEAPFPYIGRVSDYREKYGAYDKRSKKKILGDAYEDVKGNYESVPNEA